MFDHGINKKRSAKAGDVLIYSMDKGLFHVSGKNQKRPGRIDLLPKDDKILCKIIGSEIQLYTVCHVIAKLFAAAVCCNAIPFEMPKHMKRSIGFELVPFK